MQIKSLLLKFYQKAKRDVIGLRTIGAGHHIKMNPGLAKTLVISEQTHGVYRAHDVIREDSP